MNKIKLDDIQELFKNRKPETVGIHKYFSVLVPLVEKENELHVLYEVRAAHMKRQPGEICFPGGQLEAGETIQECAERETVEELGVHADAIRVLAQLDTVYTYSNFTMYCFLGSIKYEDVETAAWNPDEVQETFLVPLEDVIKQEPQLYKMDVAPVVGDDFPYDQIGMSEAYRWRTGISEVPIYKFGDKIVWGLTGRITKKFAEILRGGTL